MLPWSIRYSLSNFLGRWSLPHRERCGPAFLCVHTPAFMWRRKPLRLVSNMTHQRTGWGHCELTELLKLFHFDDIEMSFHLGNTTPNAALMKWVFLLRVTLATKGTAEIKNAQIALRSRLPLAFEPKVSSWSDGITTYRNVKNSPTLDVSFIPSDALFLRGAGKKESQAWGRKRKVVRRRGEW